MGIIYSEHGKSHKQGLVGELTEDPRFSPPHKCCVKTEWFCISLAQDKFALQILNGVRELCLCSCSQVGKQSLEQRSCYNQKWLSDAESTNHSLLLMILVGEGEENCSPDSNISDTISFSIRLKELRDSELDVHLLISSLKHQVSKFAHHRSGGLRAQGLNTPVQMERELCGCEAHHIWLSTFLH